MNCGRGFGFAPNGRPESFSVRSDPYAPRPCGTITNSVGHPDKDYGLRPEVTIGVATTAYGGSQFGEGTRRDH